MSMNLEQIWQNVWDVCVTLGQLASPIIVIMLTRKHTREDKAEEKSEAAQKEAAAKADKQKELINAINTLTTKLDENKNDIDKVSQDLRQYRDENNKLQQNLNHITMLNRMNGRYTHELAQLVMVIGEGIRDQHLDGNITKAIVKYRSFESSVLGDFISGDETPGGI